MPNPAVSGQNLSFQQLVSFTGQIKSGPSKIIDLEAGQLYAKDQPNGRHKETSKDGRQRMLTTKNIVKSAIAKQVGSKAADQIFVAHNIRTHVGTGRNKQVDGKAMSSSELAAMTRSVHKHQRDAGIKQLTPKQRTEFNGQINSFTPMKLDQALAHDQIGPILTNHMKAESASENLEIYQDINELTSLHEQFDELENSNGSSIQKKIVTKKIREQTLKVAGKIATGDYNVGSAANMAFSGSDYTPDKIENMGINDLRKLVRGDDPTNPDSDTGPIGRGGQAAKSNLKMVYGTFKIHFDNEVRSLAGANELEVLRDSMQDGAHLRSDGTGLYSKKNHGKVRFYSKGRTQKFKNAKTNVQASLSRLVGQEQAARIMQPFLNNKHGLTKADLTKIISAADVHQKAAQKTDQLARQQNTRVPLMSELARDSNSDWSQGFQAFAAARGNDTFATQLKVARLENDLANAIMDSGPDMSGRVRKNVPLDEAAFRRARTAAGDLLQRGGLPGNLKTALQRFVKLPQPPNSNSELIQQLQTYRQTNLGTGSLRQEFQAAIDNRKSEIQASQVQQQPLPQPRANQPSLQQTGPARHQTVSPDLGVFDVNMQDVDDVDFEPPSVGPNDKQGLHEEPEIEKSYTYNGGHDPIVPAGSSNEIEIEYEVD